MWSEDTELSVTLRGFWRVKGGTDPTPVTLTDRNFPAITLALEDGGRTEDFTAELTIPATASVTDLQQRICTDFGVPESMQRLFIDGIGPLGPGGGAAAAIPADSDLLGELCERTAVSGGPRHTLTAELLDLRYLQQVLEGRLPIGMTAASLMDADDTSCVNVKHREGCGGVGCSSSLCVKAGPALYLPPADGSSGPLRKYQGLFMKLVFAFAVRHVRSCS